MKASSVCKPEYRSLLAAVIKAEPEARRMFKLLKGMGAKNMRCDYMLLRMPNGVYERFPDPCAWYAEARGMFIAMIRHGENDWTLHS